MSVDGPRGATLPEVWRVADKAVETADTVTLTLEPPAVAFPRRVAAPGFAPGQFNMLYAFGRGESAISISGDPSSAGRLVHTLRAVGNVTRALAALEPGDAVGVRGPFGSAWPIADALGRDLLLVAGGLGLAPLRPAILHALRDRGAFGRVRLVAGAREPAGLLYRDALARWGAREFAGAPSRPAAGAGPAGRNEEPALEVHLTVDRADPDWQGEVGVILRPLRTIALDPARTVAFVCGPEVMMRHAADELVARGVAASAIHVSLERNMKCALARCGHCQFGRHFVCADGPVFRYDRVRSLLAVPEI